MRKKVQPSREAAELKVQSLNFGTPALRAHGTASLIRHCHLGGSTSSAPGRRGGASVSDEPENTYPQSESSSEELEDTQEPTSKRRKQGEADLSGLPCFDPAELVRSREGTFKAPKVIQQYVDKHFRRCLLKEERDALFKEHPRPDLDSCAAPKVDKYIVDFLGKRMPKEHDSELSRIQGSVLASARPLVSAWQSLLEEGIEEDPAMMVPATEVLAMIQRTLCLVGNASERLSQVRHAKILEAIDPSWKKFSEDGFPSAKDTLFGADFQSSFTSRVEKDTALIKAVAISKRSRRDPDPSSRKDRPKSSRFFRGGPPGRYGTRQGKSFFPYSASVPRNQRDGKHLPSSRFGKKPLFHEPKLPQDHNNPPQTQPRRP